MGVTRPRPARVHPRCPIPCLRVADGGNALRRNNPPGVQACLHAHGSNVGFYNGVYRGEPRNVMLNLRWTL